MTVNHFQQEIAETEIASTEHSNYIGGVNVWPQTAIATDRAGRLKKTVCTYQNGHFVIATDRAGRLKKSLCMYL